MRYLVLSDIHANLAALEAVLEDAPDFDEVWCLGDLVGYGPKPNECIERVRGLPHTSLAGNHDWAALGKLDLSSFNTIARTANEWTQRQLTSSSRGYLNGLSPSLQQGNFAMAHASPREPIWEYIMDTHTARENFEHFQTPYCLVGHTHVPVLFELDEDRGRCEALLPPLPEPVKLGSRRAIINPGSVGQPRDGDPRASYALLDTDEMTWSFHRVAYPIEVTQERMEAAGLPRRLIDRLEMGR
ncbi:MAG: metallophosphoesterase family protein [Anaerolineae bacterium]|nr:metallophosphoesterase family protein [Anaerolineae bacterium]